MKVINGCLISQIDLQLYCSPNQNFNLNASVKPRQGGRAFPINCQDLL